MLTHAIKEYEGAPFIVNWVPQIYIETLHNEGRLGHNYIQSNTIKAKVIWYKEMLPIINALKLQFPEY